MNMGTGVNKNIVYDALSNRNVEAFKNQKKIAFGDVFVSYDYGDSKQNVFLESVTEYLIDCQNENGLSESDELFSFIKGISGKQLERELGVTYKTAWRILNKIREAMNNVNNERWKEAVLEMDETYVGGKPRKPNNREDDKDQNNKRGRGTDKLPVVGMYNRGVKQIRLDVVLPEGVRKLGGKRLKRIIEQNCEDGVENIHDELRDYNFLDNSEQYESRKINHRECFVEGDTHTNSIESIWAIVKRAWYSTYHPTIGV